MRHILLSCAVQSIISHAARIHQSASVNRGLRDLPDNVITMQNEHAYAAVINAPFGAIGIQTTKGAIAKVVFLPPCFPKKVPESAVAKQATKQIQQYLKHPGFQFNLPTVQSGTNFQQRVWHAINAIPFGRTQSYGDLAHHLRSAPRAVGQACGANPCPLITPCHRVIRTSGALGGFSRQRDKQHFMLDVKRWLLAHEGIHFD